MGKWPKICSVVLALALIIPMGTSAFSQGEETGLTASRGLCTGGTTTWDMEIALETGVDIEVGVDSGIPDQEWQLVVWYNQHLEIQQIEVTEDAGDFDIRFVENNAHGKDKVELRARNLDTGEICMGQMETEL